MSPKTMKTEQTIVGSKWAPISMNALPAALGKFDDGIQLSNNYFANARALPSDWQNKEYRQVALESEVAEGIAWQIRVNREERGWRQSELAHKMGTQQSAISKLEDADGGDVRIKTLIKVAHAFDCALLIRFVSYSDFALETSDVSPERLVACGFSDENALQFMNCLAPTIFTGNLFKLSTQANDFKGDISE